VAATLRHLALTGLGLQHVGASLGDKGRAAVVIDTGAASRGSGSQGENKEKSIRRWFVEQDLVESVILLPDNLFYNTTAPGMIILLNRAKRTPRQLLLINASGEYRKGRPKNELTQEGIQKVIACFRGWKDHEGLCRVVGIPEITAADYNLSPARFVRSNAKEETGDIQAILDDLATLKKDSAVLDANLAGAFARLGYRWGL